MASSFTPNNSAASSRTVLLPFLPELFNPRFLDVLLPPRAPDEVIKKAAVVSAPLNRMMEALKATSRQTITANMAPAFSATDSAVLDAFTTLSHYTKWSQIETYLEAAWKEDSNLTLRIIWNLRSIHDGKGEKEAFYRAFGWLYENHPRTAISNLALLVEPVCESGKKKKRAQGMSHGYWKDLLNILALETVGELSNMSSQSTFLHAPRVKPSYGKSRMQKPGISGSRIEASVLVDALAKEAASATRKVKNAQSFERLCRKLADPKFRALFIAVARLFSDQLLNDVDVLLQLESLKPDEDRIAHLKKLTLAGKWAPSPGASHDRVTNIATAISELIYASQALPSFPSILKTSISDAERAHVLRSFYQRWVLTELRRAQCCPEPLMAANRWTEIKYSRVPSICMKNNKEHFFKHDPQGFEEYLVDVESGKRKISGATLLPHELVAQAIKADDTQLAGDNSKFPALQALKKRQAEAEVRVIESQWKTLISNLRESGSIENAIAVCDVSGSMGYLNAKYNKNHVQPILPAISLSLVLASLAKPPFNGGFITFSSVPHFVTLDLEQPLVKLVRDMSKAHWNANTDFSAVFLRLLLPLAVKNQVKPEDMIKRLFVFSDMQFDQATCTRGHASDWETNHDVVEKAYREAGYEIPQIVYWDLSTDSGMTKEVESSTKKGVAMMNGFSPAMLRVFMGDEVEGETEWETVDEDGETIVVVEKNEDEFNPINVMKKALMKTSFGGLRVVD